ncbi:MAG: hypothetical protein ACFFE4_00480 [Candidatus Thorarchaeota archaeon]
MTDLTERITVIETKCIQYDKEIFNLKDIANALLDKINENGERLLKISNEVSIMRDKILYQINEKFCNDFLRIDERIDKKIDKNKNIASLNTKLNIWVWLNGIIIVNIIAILFYFIKTKIVS